MCQWDFAARLTWQAAKVEEGNLGGHTPGIDGTRPADVLMMHWKLGKPAAFFPVQDSMSKLRMFTSTKDAMHVTVCGCLCFCMCVCV